MLYKFVFVFAFFMVLADFTPAQSRTTGYGIEFNIMQLEEGCVRQGGLCSREEDCEPGNTVAISGVNLCPAQAHLGAVCCYQ